MFEYLKGHLISKTDTQCILEVHGAGYLLNITPFMTCNEGEQDVVLYIRSFVREDGEHSFYGFQDIRERQVFDFLRQIKGIGPRTALRIVSRVPWNELCSLISQDNIEVLVVRSRLGEKTVKRVVLEMKNRLEKISWDETPEEGTLVWQETRGVLMQLGFSTGEIERVLRELASRGSGAENTENMVKQALHLMGGHK